MIRTGTIEFQVLPKTPNGKGPIKYRTLQSESQEDSFVPTDGQMTIRLAIQAGKQNGKTQHPA